MKKKFLVTSEDGANYRIIDKTDSERIRFIKLKADKHDTRWTVPFRGAEAMRLVDHGNGLCVTGKDIAGFDLSYSDAAELLILLEHLDSNSNCFCKRTKTEIK